MRRRAPLSTLFPYTTLFRSVPAERLAILREAFHAAVNDPKFLDDAKRQRIDVKEVPGERIEQVMANAFAAPRSEEHTSELQSQSNLVCRLLLEKKKQNNKLK